MSNKFKKRFHSIFKSKDNQELALMEGCGWKEIIDSEFKGEEELLLGYLEDIRPYYTASELAEKVHIVMEKGFDHLLRCVDVARDIVPDEKLIPELIIAHEKHPWAFYVYSDRFRHIFPSSFFISKFKEDPSLKETHLWDMFKFFFSDYPVTAYSEGLLNLVKEECGGHDIQSLVVGNRREAGFGCGGMDKNFREALASGEGCTFINDLFIAKFFHRKGHEKAKKVSLICNKSGITDSGYPLYKNFIYSPSQGQHEEMIRAISNKEKTLNIEGLVVRPVRPLIGTSSEELFDLSCIS